MSATRLFPGSLRRRHGLQAIPGKFGIDAVKLFTERGRERQILPPSVMHALNGSRMRAKGGQGFGASTRSGAIQLDSGGIARMPLS